MNNKIETLRATWFTKDESPEIQGFDFSEDDKKLVEEFKKIYELGIPQLQKFISILDQSDDTYNILYFKSVLRNGPFKAQVEPLIKASKKLKDLSDNMGNVGIPVYSMQNVVVFEGTECGELSKTVSSKLPKFMDDVFKSSIKVAEDVFRGGVTSSASIDNTLPIEDKRNQARYGAEPSGGWTSDPNANYMVKDRYFYLQIQSIESQIKGKVDAYIQERTKILEDIKDYNPFEKDKNKSLAATPKKNKITEKVDGEEMELDLMGDIMVTKKQLNKKVKISSKTSNKQINPNTNKGQLDS